MQTYYVKSGDTTHLIGCENCSSADMADVVKDEPSCEDCGAEAGDENVVEGDFGGEPTEEEMDELDNERDSLKEEWGKFGMEMAEILTPVVLPALVLCRKRLPKLIEKSLGLAEKAVSVFSEEGD